jgi:hypothetical protein
MVAIKQGGIAKTAISGVIETIDSMINHGLFPTIKWSPSREIVQENNV